MSEENVRNLSEPCREKHWSEAEPDEKANRLRTEVKGLQRVSAGLQDALHGLLNHVHVDGALAFRSPNPSGFGMATQSFMGGMQGGPDAGGDDVYF